MLNSKCKYGYLQEEIFFMHVRYTVFKEVGALRWNKCTLVNLDVNDFLERLLYLKIMLGGWVL